MSIRRDLHATISLEQLESRQSISNSVVCYGGGGKSPEVKTVEAPPPPAPPAEEATMQDFTDPTVDKKKTKAKTQGAKSLQIPLVGTTGTNATVGTVSG